MKEIPLDRVRSCLANALDLLDGTYASDAPGSGGWYHRLDSNVPGPSATSVALHSYLLLGRLPTHVSEGLAFLRARQISAEDVLLDGGWAVNTSDGQPLLESTSLAVRLLSTGRMVASDEAPSLRRGRAWIIRNRNTDGGWGSFAGQPSRVWLTTMAVRALIDTDPTDTAVLEGVQWLLRTRHAASGGWGEAPRSEPTITHTSYVLCALVESRLSSTRPEVATAIEQGYQWLRDHLDPQVVVDDLARVESYNLTIVRDNRPFTWQNSVWHPSLPYALSALVRDPSGLSGTLIASATHTLIRAQTDQGNWPNADGAAGVSIWSVWPYVEALSDLLREPLLLNSGKISWVTDHTILVTRGKDIELGAARIAARLLFSRFFALLRRQWATVLLGIVLLTGVTFWLVQKLDLKDLMLALIFPILLLVIQELLARRQSRSVT